MLFPPDSSSYSNDPNKVLRFIQSSLDALSSHIAILDQEGAILAVNSAWQNFAIENDLNDPDFSIGKNYLTVCDSSANTKAFHAAEVATGIRQVISEEIKEFVLEYPCHSPSEKRWFIMRVSSFDWNGHKRIIVAHQNVSELKIAQVELQENKRRIEAIINNVNNGIITLNIDGYIDSANHATTHMFSYPEDYIIGFHISDLILELNIMQDSLNQLTKHFESEMTGIRSDGSEFPIYFSVNHLVLDNGFLYTCIIQDITFQKRVQAEIIKRERMEIALEKERELRILKNRFLSMMGHELNTPLASISLSYDMLRKYRDVSTSEENDQALDNINQQIGHLRDMIKDVMTLSRSETEGLSLSVRKINLVVYCQDIAEEFHFIHGKTHSVDFQSSESVIMAQIDERLLRRAFTNLLSNAIKYSPTGGTVFFSITQNNENEAVLEVIDSGIGIPNEDRLRLFEPFHRASNTDGLPGTGLGLAIVKLIIELHGGSIDFTSNLGLGTTFKIQLPLGNT